MLVVGSVISLIWHECKPMCMHVCVCVFVHRICFTVLSLMTQRSHLHSPCRKTCPKRLHSQLVFMVFSLQSALIQEISYLSLSYLLFLRLKHVLYAPKSVEHIGLWFFSGLIQEICTELL